MEDCLEADFTPRKAEKRKEGRRLWGIELQEREKERGNRERKIFNLKEIITEIKEKKKEIGTVFFFDIENTGPSIINYCYKNPEVIFEEVNIPVTSFVFLVFCPIGKDFDKGLLLKENIYLVETELHNKHNVCGAISLMAGNLSNILSCPFVFISNSSIFSGLSSLLQEHFSHPSYYVGQCFLSKYAIYNR